MTAGVTSENGALGRQYRGVGGKKERVDGLTAGILSQGSTATSREHLAMSGNTFWLSPPGA